MRAFVDYANYENLCVIAEIDGEEYNIPVWATRTNAAGAARFKVYRKFPKAKHVRIIKITPNHEASVVIVHI